MFIVQYISIISIISTLKASDNIIFLLFYDDQPLYLMVVFIENKQYSL